MWFFLVAAFFVVFNFRNSKEIQFRPTVVRSLITVLFMVWSVMSFAGIATSIYFILWLSLLISRRKGRIMGHIK